MRSRLLTVLLPLLLLISCGKQERQQPELAPPALGLNMLKAHISRAGHSIFDADFLLLPPEEVILCVHEDQNLTEYQESFSRLIKTINKTFDLDVQIVRRKAFRNCPDGPVAFVRWFSGEQNQVRYSIALEQVTKQIDLRDDQWGKLPQSKLRYQLSYLFTREARPTPFLTFFVDPENDAVRKEHFVQSVVTGNLWQMLTSFRPVIVSREARSLLELPEGLGYLSARGLCFLDVWSMVLLDRFGRSKQGLTIIDSDITHKVIEQDYYVLLQEAQKIWNDPDWAEIIDEGCDQPYELDPSKREKTRTAR